MGDVAERAREVVALLEAGDVDAVLALVAPGAREAMRPGVLADWGRGVQGAIGGSRSVAQVEDLDDRSARVLLRGERGVLAVTVRTDGRGELTALAVGVRVEDGVRNIVIGCPFEADAARRLADFYGAVLGMRIVREDWLKVGADIATFPHLAFGDGWSDARPPRWRDPDYPHQAHLDVDVADLEAAVALAIASGGSVLERGGSGAIVSDPFGHPVALRSGAADEPKLAAVTFQCDDPPALADFWGALLGMPDRRDVSSERVEIAPSAGGLALAFERVDGYVAPRWHDPQYPEQIHLDLHFNDPDAARRRAEELGAAPLPPPRGSCAVYADPAGHPFCLCSSVGTESAHFLPLIGG